MKFHHILEIRDLSKSEIEFLLLNAQNNLLAGHSLKHRNLFEEPPTQINLFYENSTRTRTSFELAGKRLGLDVVTLNSQVSSAQKGESLLDTLQTLDAMRPNILVLRHPLNKAFEAIVPHIRCHVINAGDGTNEHPTQALLDALTIQEHTHTIEGLKIAICGDILHSRVARSNIFCLSLLGAEIRLVAPPYFMPIGEFKGINFTCFDSMEEGLQGVDAIIMLRIQKERFSEQIIPSLEAYCTSFCLTENRLKLAKKNAIVLHPGPVNRDLEISTSILSSKQSRINRQVEIGLALRMTLIELLCQQDLSKNKK